MHVQCKYSTTITVAEAQRNSRTSDFTYSDCYLGLHSFREKERERERERGKEERKKMREGVPGEGVGLTDTGACLLGVCVNEDNTGGSFHPWMLVLRASKATLSLPPLGGSL